MTCRQNSRSSIMLETRRFKDSQRGRKRGRCCASFVSLKRSLKFVARRMSRRGCGETTQKHKQHFGEAGENVAQRKKKSWPEKTAREPRVSVIRRVVSVVPQLLLPNTLSISHNCTLSLSLSPFHGSLRSPPKNARSAPSRNAARSARTPSSAFQFLSCGGRGGSPGNNGG